ncbi:uncharacterized protein AC631_03513 [Debaryomyces fabryi]|uniref:Spindle pole body component Bbp1 C-terminal domain-containing protein n=1 Tax=Debaryomyces fabryi TaxID=58627 RepID=A0A0V1PWW4_9ASCO|nr:uncharacterized protein AC631_03513 [Debaryomyces fabryi]KSA00743.1 hypothetical protein AC631_03513 [Debaryomyces fabryi]CUM47128.1 unnamed protein product [Debaryomyces fabryi]
METPKKGILSKAYSSLFGPTSPLTNEPTVDYNNTIQTYPRYNEDTISTKPLQRSHRQNAEKSENNDRQYKHDLLDKRETLGRDSQYKDLFSDHYIIDSQVLDDSDDELNSDIDYIFNRYNHTNEVVNNLSERVPGSLSTGILYRDTPGLRSRTQKRLPTDYPGRYPSPLVLKRESYEPKYVDSIDNDLKSLEREINLENDITTAQLNAKYNKYTSGYSNGAHKGSGDEDRVVTKNDKRLLEIFDRVKDRNKFLNELNAYVDLSSQVEVPTDINEKYKALREEYIKELTNCQNFYKAYYKLVFKYRNLKKQISRSSTTTMREKIKLIKSTSHQLSIRIICDNLLIEVDKNDRTIAHYQNELDIANSKIKHLEDKLAEQGPASNR